MRRFPTSFFITHEIVYKTQHSLTVYKLMGTNFVEDASLHINEHVQENRTKLISPRRNIKLIWLLVVLLIASFLRFSYLNQVSYWFDESVSLKVVEFPLVEMMSRLIYGDDHPPLFFLILKVWVLVFDHPLVMPRMLSVFCSLATIVGSYCFIKEAYQFHTENQKHCRAEFAAILAMLPNLAIWSSYFLFRAMFRIESSKRDWILFTLFSVAQFYTHYFGLFIAMAQYLFALSYALIQRFQNKSLRREFLIQPVLFSGIASYFCFLPWLLVFLDHRQKVTEKFHAPDLTWSTAGTRLGIAYDLQWGWSITPETGLFVGQFFFIIFLLLAIHRRPADYFLIMVSAFPFLAAAITSVFMRNIFVGRYLIAAQMFSFLSIAVVISDIPWRLFRWSSAVILVLSMSLLAKEQFLTRQFNASLPGMQSAVSYLDQQRHPDDIAMICNPMLFTSIVLYTNNRDGLFVPGAPGRYPFFQGAGVMRDDEFQLLYKMNQPNQKRVWTFDADKWLGGTWSVPMSEKWHEVSRKRFKEFNAEFIVRCYERNLPEENTAK